MKPMKARPFKQVDVFTSTPYFGNALAVVLDGTDLDDAAMQRTRMAQRMVDASTPRVGGRWFFAVGTDEESSDRDHDGIACES